MSPYLFVLCLQKLFDLIDASTQNGQWQTLTLCLEGLLISHVFFTDDLILFGKATVKQCEVMLDCLNTFYAFSGQKVNFQKSILYTSKNVKPKLVRNLELLSAMKHSTFLGKYLGVPIHSNCVSKDTYHELFDKVKKRLSGWKASQLSLAGRSTLVQSVSSTIATYTMQTARLPSAVTREIDKLNRSFLWGSSDRQRKIPLLK